MGWVMAAAPAAPAGWWSGLLFVSCCCVRENYLLLLLLNTHITTHYSTLRRSGQQAALHSRLSRSYTSYSACDHATPRQAMRWVGQADSQARCDYWVMAAAPARWCFSFRVVVSEKIICYYYYLIHTSQHTTLTTTVRSAGSTALSSPLSIILLGGWLSYLPTSLVFYLHHHCLLI